jgi:hypothetical protein
MAKTFWAALAMALCTLAAWSQDAASRFVLTHRSESALMLGSVESPRQTLTVPAETEVPVQVLSGIHTRVNHVNDFITARLLQPVYVNGYVALPSGSLLDGRVTFVRSSGRWHRSAELGLRFERITLPNGQEEPLAAVLGSLEKVPALDFHLDAEGHLVGGRGFSWKSVLVGVAGMGALGGVKAATGPAVLSKFLPLAGAALVGYEIAWPRGHEVNLAPETRCRLRLNYPLTVRVPW